MIARVTSCDRDLLRLALMDDLSTVHQEQLEAHLTTCELCRHELERLAGGDAWLSEVREHLSSTEVPQYRHRANQPVEAVDDEMCSETEADQLNFLDPSSNPEMLGRLGTYEVESIIGRGGMGVVLKALDPALNRHVAIKVLAAELATSGSARRRFSREAQAAAAIAHEHVVAIHAVDNSGKLPFLVMPYIPGKSLQERLDQAGPLEICEVLRISLQAASGLAAAHAQGLVHRDIKPANILLENGIERVRITDFGLARAVDDASQTQSGFIAGTPQYMAPEQARGEPVDHRADLFSLGSVMYAMCTGRPPFRAETTLAVLRRICEETPRPLKQINPDVPDWLQAIVSKLLARDPAERFQSAAEVAEVLQQYLAHLQQPTARPLPKIHRSWSKSARLTRLVSRPIPVVVGIGLVVIGLVIAEAWYANSPNNRRSGATNWSSGSTSSPGIANSTASGGSGAMSSSPIANHPGARPMSPPGPPSVFAPANPWLKWDQDLLAIEDDLQALEHHAGKRLDPGISRQPPADIHELAVELKSLEVELDPRGAKKREPGM